MADVYARTEEWIAGDPDPATRSELRALVDAGAADELAERMAGTLEFGTAGLRGRVEAGSNRMNRATVIRATRGLADHLLAVRGDDRGPVVVGRDARLSSAEFMEDTIAVLAAAGLAVVYFPDPTPTPIVAFTARLLGAVAAVVITASHNPPADNGYKVYAGNAAQIVPPVDGQIAAAIAGVGAATAVPRAADPFHHPDVVRAPDDIGESYLAEVAEAVPDLPGERGLSIVYTPLHGVGGRWVIGALERFGFKRVHPVAAQWEPDGRFPSVSFPNPEEPGALDLAHELAAAIDADLVIANDPDTDRLSVSAPDMAGGWRQLTGNQVGSLLGDFLLEHSDEPRPIVISSIVSSPHLARIAAFRSARYESTLTGFKWICNAAMALEEADRGRFVFGYEEALGYSVGRVVRDKDGISAAVAFAILTAVAKAGGWTLWDRLADLAARDGLWVSTQRSVVRPGSDGVAQIEAAVDAVASEPPTMLDGHPVVAVTDYRTGAADRPPWLGATPLVELDLGTLGRALIRPSGTEPKLKVYVDATAPFAAGTDWLGADAALLAVAAGIADSVVERLGMAG